MPEVDSTIHECSTVGEAWNWLTHQIYDSFFDTFIGDDTSQSFSIIDWNGYSALQYEFVKPAAGFTRRFIAPVLSLSYGQFSTARDIISQAGISSTFSWGITDNTRQTGFQALFEDFIADYKFALLDALTLATVDDPVISTALGDAGFVETTTSTVVATDDSGTVASMDVMRIGGTAPVVTGNDYQIEPPSTPAPQPAAAPPDVTALVEVLKSIADQDFQISFNNGAFVFSIKGNVLAEGGGGGGG